MDKVELATGAEVLYVGVSSDLTTKVVLKWKGVEGVGIAKCNPIDYFNATIGVQIASTRAIIDIVSKIENVWVTRAKTKEEVLAKRNSKYKDMAMRV